MIQTKVFRKRSSTKFMRSRRFGHVGWRVWALGVVLLGLVSLANVDFDPGQPAPKALPGRMLLACGADIFMVIAGAAVEWPRFTSRAAAALTAYYAIVVVVLLNGRVVLAHPALLSSYSNAAEQLALAAAGLIVYAEHAPITPRRALLLGRFGRAAFGLCAVLFGCAHFAYMDQTAPLVPKWLPFSSVFWGEATGLAQIAAGLAIITGLGGRPASILLTFMYAAFTPLVHIPLLLRAPRTVFFWTENALNIALIGAAWVVANSQNEIVMGRAGLLPAARR